VALFSQESQFDAKSGTNGLTVSQVEQAIAPVIRKWKQAPSVKVVQSVDALPDHARAPLTPDSRPSGLYTGDVIYLVADNISNQRRALEVLAHEAIGHHSLEQILGEDYEGIVEQVVSLKRVGNKRILGVVEELKARYTHLDPNTRQVVYDLTDERQEAKEILAVMAEQCVRDNLPVSLWKRIKVATDQFLKKLGFSLPFSDTAIDALLQKAERYLKTGREEQRLQHDSGAIYEDTDKHVTITEITGTEIKRGVVTRADAQSYANDRLRGKIYRNASSGMDIEIAKKGINELLSHAFRRSDSTLTQTDLKALAALPEMIKRAILFDSSPDRKSRYGIHQVHTLYAPIRLRDVTYRAKLIVKDTFQGNKYYGPSLEDIEIEKPDVKGQEDNGSTVSFAGRPSGSTMNIKELLYGVKGKIKLSEEVSSAFTQTMDAVLDGKASEPEKTKATSRGTSDTSAVEALTPDVPAQARSSGRQARRSTFGMGM